MKRLIYILPLVLLIACSKPAKSTANAEPTDSVTVEQLPCTTIIHLTDLPATNDVLKKSSPNVHFAYMEEEFDEQLIVCSDLADSITYCSLPFLTSARLAYAQHRPLIVNPDVVWLVIESGFANHVYSNAEELRSKFVNFEGKKALRVYAETSLLKQPAEVWEPLFSKFTEQIAQWVSPEFVQTLQADFSTTTPAASVASNIMIMSAMQHYFEYSIICICGIPDIYLEGSEEDWKKLISKANALRQYDLDWWIDEIEPVLQKIAAAAAGEIDITFWQSIIRKKDIPVEGEEMCGWIPPHEQIDGWIVKFYPYTIYNTRNKLNFLYDTDIADLPGEVGAAPLNYTDIDGTKYDFDIHAGLIGIEEDTTTRALRPVVAWWVTQPLEEGERYK